MKGILSESPVAKVLLVAGVVLVLIGVLAGASAVSGLGWAAILASAVLGAFFNV